MYTCSHILNPRSRSHVEGNLFRTVKQVNVLVGEMMNRMQAEDSGLFRAIRFREVGRLDRHVRESQRLFSPLWITEPLQRGIVKVFTPRW